MKNQGKEGKLFTYRVEFNGYEDTIQASTPGKAKYNYFKSNEIEDGYDFKDFIKNVHCRKIGEFKIQDLFTDNLEEFERMKKNRGIEFAYLGERVQVGNRTGYIVGYYGFNLLICFEGQSWSDNCHPWSHIKYYDNNGNIIREYAD